MGGVLSTGKEGGGETGIGVGVTSIGEPESPGELGPGDIGDKG